MELDDICRAAVRAGASDILLHEGKRPHVRVSGLLAEVDSPAVTAGLIEELFARCNAPAEALDHDAAYVSSDGERFRVNLFRQCGLRGAAMRWVRQNVPALDSLGLPEELIKSWVSRRNGIVLVTGPAGSGKSTTLAAALDHLNRTAFRHIVTIEDPIEYLFADRDCVFTQREVRIDVGSFGEGLRSALRQSPDVVFLGEIRDAPSAETALHAAETGHLLLATIHGSSASEAVSRFLQIFSAGEQLSVRSVLSAQLIGVLSQRLLPAIPGGMALATEYFSNVGIARKYVAEGKFEDLADWIRREDGRFACSMIRSVADLCRKSLVDESTAAGAVENADDLRRMLLGISSGSSASNRSS